MNRLLLTIFGLFSFATCFCQTGYLHGQIYDRHNSQGVRYVSLRLLRTTLTTLSDSTGYFKIDSIPFGTYDLKVYREGVGDTTLTGLQITKDTIADLFIGYPWTCRYTQPRNEVTENTCPICHKEGRVIPIVYGKPARKLIQDSRLGKVRLGGCVIFGCEPHWYCKRDDYEF